MTANHFPAAAVKALLTRQIAEPIVGNEPLMAAITPIREFQEEGSVRRTGMVFTGTVDAADKWRLGGVGNDLTIRGLACQVAEVLDNGDGTLSFKAGSKEGTIARIHRGG